MTGYRIRSNDFDGDDGRLVRGQYQNILYLITPENLALGTGSRGERSRTGSGGSVQRGIPDAAAKSLRRLRGPSQVGRRHRSAEERPRRRRNENSRFDRVTRCTRVLRQEQRGTAGKEAKRWFPQYGRFDRVTLLHTSITARTTRHSR